MIKFALMSFVTYNCHICYQMVNDPLGNQNSELAMPLNQNITAVAVEMTDRKHLNVCDLPSQKHL